MRRLNSKKYIKESLPKLLYFTFFNPKAQISHATVKESVFSLPADKAPGSDGFAMAFFQECWKQ